MKMKKGNDDKLPNLGVQATDHIVTVSRMGLGAVPVFGSALSELATMIIPNQRLERVVDFAQKLHEKTKNLEESFISTQLTDENFVDILEEGMTQAAKSVAEKRRGYIASVIAHGLSEDQIEFMETRRVLKLLSELNDNEIILLRFYLVPTIGGDEEFRSKHESLLKVRPATINAQQRDVEKEAIHNSYIENLCNYGLLRKEYSVDITDKIEYDKSTQAPKIRRTVITSLGKYFLRQIGLN